MSGSLALFVLGGLLAGQAAALHLGLPGLLLMPRRAPRALWPVAALAALLAIMAGAALAPSVWIALGAAALGLLVAGALTVVLASAVPLDPDARFLPGTTSPWSATFLPVPDQPDAGAVLLRPGGDGDSGICVVVSHGGGNDRLFGLWHLLSRLLKRGHSVVIAQLAGHGRGGSDLFAADTTRARLDGVLLAARDAVHPHRLVLLGQSMGAAIALDALGRGASVESVVAVSPLTRLRVGTAVLREAGALLRPAIYRALAYATPAELLPSAGPVRRDAFPVRVAPGGSYIKAFEHALREFDLRVRLPERPHPETPVLLIHGMADGIVPASESVHFAEALGPCAQLRIHRRMHHLDPLFDDRVIEEIEDFLEATRQAIACR